MNRTSKENKSQNAKKSNEQKETLHFFLKKNEQKSIQHLLNFLNLKKILRQIKFKYSNLGRCDLEVNDDWSEGCLHQLGGVVDGVTVQHYQL